ncbi:MAG TPA: hypothetical protein VK658_10370 [Chryseolinea sp.]|nr:hypothetical protein [Chryseolinea sp.]
MSKKFIILALGLTWSIQLFGQAERQAIENIWKGKWEKAFYQLDRAANKDTIQVTTAYAWAIYFGAEANPDYSLDSASRYIRASVVLFGQASDKQRERLRRFPLDSLTLIAERNRVDSAAFVVARGQGSAVAYQRFIDIHPGAVAQPDAIAARDERAYQDAVEANTYEAFYDYLGRYPRSTRVDDARANYERLLYHFYTRDRDLTGFERFLREHPGTSFEGDAQRNIFEILTADGSREAFTRYLSQQPHYRKRAADILFHLDTGEASHKFPESAWSDSLRAMAGDDPLYVAPYLEGGRFGFMDPAGHQVFDASSAAVDDDYLCGNITDNFIRLDSSVVALNGAVIYSGAIDEIEDIGLGMLLIRSKTCQRVVHKSGWLVTPGCVDQAKMIADRFLAVQRQEKWQLLSLSGRAMMTRLWDGITSVNQIVVMESAGEKYAATPGRIAAFAASPRSRDPFVRIDRISRWSAGITWLRIGNDEMLLDVKSDTLASSAGGTLAAARFGIVIRDDTSSHTVNWKGESSATFRAIQVSNMRAIVLAQSGWRMFDPVHNVYNSPSFDSLWWTGSFAMGTVRDSTHLFFPDGLHQKLKGKLHAASIQGPDSTTFLLVDGGPAKPRRLYARNGALLFQVPYEKIQPIGMGYFRVTKAGKVGLAASDGKLVVPVVMDAIGAIGNNAVSLLRDGRFGLFNCVTRKVVQPQYPTNLLPYGKQYIVAQKNGLSGLFTWDNKPVSKFEHEEVRYWNDTAAFVRRDTRWSLINLRNNTVVVQQIRGFRFIRDVAGDQLAIVHVGDAFGVLHSRKGTVIPPTFTDIVNLGSSEWPLYFTEKHIEEASMYVVIYYDREGKFLRKEVYNSEDYERIYCPNN